MAVVAAVAVAMVALLFSASPAPLTSDESLYVSEAVSIAEGFGPRYSSGDLIHHRPFVYPALLALPMKLSGSDEGAYWVTKLVVVANAALLFALAKRLFGFRPAVACTLLVATNSYLTGLGTTLYLDGTQTLFLLACLLCLWQVREAKDGRWHAAGGGALALAFLTKEAALLWLPLPLILALVEGEPRRLHDTGWRLASFYVAFAAIAGWWWAYVYAVDGRVFMVGSPGSAIRYVATGGAILGLLTVLAFSLGRLRPSWRPALLRAAGVGITAGWIALFAYIMETTSWPFPKDFATTVPAYLRDVVAGNVGPWPLTVAAVAVMLVRARDHDSYRLLALAFALWLPFALFAANRNFALRDLLPMVYITYAVAGIVLIDFLSWLRRETGGAAALACGALIVGALAAFAGTQVHTFATAGRLNEDGWDNALNARTAGWIEANVPAGSTIMSSRLYHSHLYTLLDARYRVVQLPTVNVVPDVDATPYLRRRSTLFRWEDSSLGEPRADERWITVDEYPAKGYYTALSELDLLEQIARRGAAFLVISGEDTAFSSTRYLDYFLQHPAFSLEHRDEPDALHHSYVFRIDASKLMPIDYRAAVPARTLNSLFRAHGGRLAPEEFLHAIDADGVVARPAAGLDSALAPYVEVPE